MMNAVPEDATNQPQRLTNNQAIDDRPVFSIDGTKITFETQQDGNNEIYVMDAVDTNPADGNGDNPTNLTNNPAQDFGPDLSPGGSKIAFASNRRNPGKSKYAIYTANSSDGSEVTRITRRPKRADDRFPVFSPDGNKLAFVKRGDTFAGGGTDYNIYTMNVNGTARTKLTGAAGIDSQPSWGSAP